MAIFTCTLPADKISPECTYTQGGPEGVPVFRDENGFLREIDRKDFPKTKAGRLAWYDYIIEKFNERRLSLTGNLPKAQTLASQVSKYQRKIEKLLKQKAEALAAGNG